MCANKLLLKPEEVDDLLGLGRSTVYRMLRRGELPSVRVGRAVRVPCQELERWVERHTARGVEEGVGDE